MIIAEYAPQFKKKKEKLLTIALLVLALTLYVTVALLNPPFPWLFQLLAMASLAFSIMLISMCLMRRYIYRIEEKDGNVDFLISEYYSRRITVVCRVSLSSVLSVTPFSSEAQQQAMRLEDGKRLPYFRYSEVLFGEERYLLTIDEKGERFCAMICANQDFISYFS